jgi:endo-1,4-beta-xylanase
MKVSTLLVAVALTAARIIAAEASTVVPLWPNGAPGSEARKAEPDQIANERVTNVHFPTLTVFLPPPDRATGCAVVIAPGGGHGHVTIAHEGYAVAQWLAAHGVAGFVLKYRLAKDEAAGGKSPYTVDVHELADTQRALRLVRARASEWGIDPARVGVMGFSAGGELAVLAATRGDAGKAGATDSIERQSSRPNFAALMYPGGLTRPDVAPTKDFPPVFLCCGGDDRLSEPLAAFYVACRKAEVSAEMHVFAGVGHGFGIQEKNKPNVAGWPERFHTWLADRKFVTAPF